jgi:hypothetical protein
MEETSVSDSLDDSLAESKRAVGCHHHHHHHHVHEGLGVFPVP